MASLSDASAVGRLRPSRGTLLWGALAVNTELLLLVAYAAYGSADLLSLAGLRLWIYPFVWINVGLWAVVRTDPPTVAARTRHLTLLLAVAYFGVLAYTGGMVGRGHGPETFRVAWRALPPGWAPAVTYTGFGLSLAVVPYKLVGYAALAYLVYATVLDATGSAVTGVLGLLSCVSCSWPVAASLVTGVVGSGSGLASAATARSYGISTAVFVVTVALLYWRPFRRE